MQPDEGVVPRCAGEPQGSGETVAEFAVAGREGANTAKEGLSIAECPYKRPDQHLRRRAWVSGHAAGQNWNPHCWRLPRKLRKTPARRTNRC